MKNFKTLSFALHSILNAMLVTGVSFIATSMNAQTFPGTGFTLPAGKTIVITYEVDVNANVCPMGTLPADISNQSSVSGSNFPTVLTNKLTLTTVSGLTLRNVAYKVYGNSC